MVIVHGSTLGYLVYVNGFIFIYVPVGVKVPAILYLQLLYQKLMQTLLMQYLDTWTLWKFLPFLSVFDPFCPSVCLLAPFGLAGYGILPRTQAYLREQDYAVSTNPILENYFD